MVAKGQGRRWLPLVVVASAFAASGYSSGLATASEIFDRRVESRDTKLSAELAAVARSVAFIEVLSAQQLQRAKSLPDGGSAILVTDCLLLTAGHVLAAIVNGSDKTTIRVRFPAAVPADGIVKSYSAKLIARGDSSRMRNAVQDDWALVRLTDAAPTAMVGLAPTNCCGWEKIPLRAAIAGFPIDRFNADKLEVWFDPACSITRRLPIQILATNCQATSGNSGGPLLVASGEDWLLAGIITRAPPPGRTGVITSQTSYAIPLDRRIQRAIAQAAVEPCPAKKA